MNRALRTHRDERDDRGVIALEFVLALPFLLMLIIGIVVLGNRPERRRPRPPGSPVTVPVPLRCASRFRRKP